MAQKSDIGWCDGTLNAVVGCAKVSPGCKNCYAIGTCHVRSCNPTQAVRDKFAGITVKTHNGVNWNGNVTFHPQVFDMAIKRKKPTRYFVNALSDLYYEKVLAEWVDKHFEVFARCPQHTFQVLTKRAERMYADCVNRQPLPNVWLGVSVEDQKWAEHRIPWLLETPATVRFLSMEPLIGEVNLWKIPGADKLDWIIVGGESGPNARPMHPAWVSSIEEFCWEHSIPFFFKQWGSWGFKRIQLPIAIDDFSSLITKSKANCIWDGCLQVRMPKSEAGNLFRGGQFLEMPGMPKPKDYPPPPTDDLP